MSSRYCAAEVDQLPTGDPVGCGRYVGNDTYHIGILYIALDTEGDQQIVPLCDECRESLSLQGLIVGGADL